jgi:hypothetical protein
VRLSKIEVLGRKGANGGGGHGMRVGSAFCCRNYSDAALRCRVTV